MKHLIVIPARMSSTRFPGKPLARINGKEMILHVAERASLAGDTIVATPDVEIHDLVMKKGFNCFITKNNCLTGTDRVCEVAEAFPEYDIYVNVQGDEPLIKAEFIEKVVISKILYYNVIINGITSIDLHDMQNTNIVKAFVDAKHRIQDLSRKGGSNFKQCGLYAFNHRELKAYAEIPYLEKKQLLEEFESIEMKLFMNLGFNVKAVEIDQTQSVDVVEDIKKVMEVMKNGR